MKKAIMLVATATTIFISSLSFSSEIKLSQLYSNEQWAGFHEGKPKNNYWSNQKFSSDEKSRAEKHEIDMIQTNCYSKNMDTNKSAIVPFQIVVEKFYKTKNIEYKFLFYMDKELGIVKAFPRRIFQISFDGVDSENELFAVKEIISSSDERQQLWVMPYDLKKETNVNITEFIKKFKAGRELVLYTLIDDKIVTTVCSLKGFTKALKKATVINPNI